MVLRSNLIFLVDWIDNHLHREPESYLFFDVWWALKPISRLFDDETDHEETFEKIDVDASDGNANHVSDAVMQ